MNDIWQAFKLLTSHGIGFLRLFDELSPHDLSDEGIEITLAKNYARLATELFSPCDSPRLQHEAIALAEERNLSATHLLMINKHARKLKARGAAWKLRAELIALEGSLEEVEACAKKRVIEEGGDKQKQRGVRVGRVIDGLRTISITDTQRRITDLEKPSTPPSQMMNNHALKHCWSHSGTSSRATALGSSNLNAARSSPSALMTARKSPVAKATRLSSVFPMAPR